MNLIIIRKKKYPTLFKNFISSSEKKKDKMKEKGASFVTMYLKNSTLHFTRVAFPEKQKLQQM